MSETIVRAAKPALLDDLRKDADTVIEASAGTGKTFTIENLVIELLLTAPESQPVTIENILVVTFTEKATAELRGRLREKIEKLAHQVQSDPEGDAFWNLDDAARRRLRQALFSFDAAPIHTIHGFCQRVLTENAFQNRQLFQQERVDAHIAFSRTFRAMLRDTFTRDKEIAPLLSTYLSAKTVADLEKLLLKVIGLGGEIQPAWDEEQLKASLEELIAFYDDAAFQKDCSGSKAVKANVAKFFEHVAQYRQLDDIRDLCALMDGFPQVNIPKKATEATARFIDGLNAWRCSYPAGPSLLVQKMLPRVQARLSQEKKQKGIYDFQDMLSRVWETVSAEGSGEALTASLRDRYRYAILDEFQDTDEMQWGIFKALFVDSRQNTLFVVGDPKQAIYGFRGCDVHTYGKAVHQILADGREPYRLPANFRSTQGIVDGYNRILADSRKQEADADVPGEFFTGFNRYPQPVTCGFPDLRLCRADGRAVDAVQLLHYKPTDTAKLNAATLRRVYGQEIAAEIRTLLTDSGAVHLLRNGEVPAPTNRLQAKDVFVLTESNAQAVEMSKYLRSAGVPFAFYKQEGLFQTAEAGDIRDVLAAIVEPARTSHRLKAWGSPFFAVPWRELPACRELPASDALFERLLSWKIDADAEDFGRLFGRIMDESGIVERELFQKDSERDITNYRHIFEVLLEVAARNRCPLEELLGTLDNFINEAASPEGENGGIQRIESEKDAVQIMTLHKSKGLQAGIVFLYSLGGKGPSDVFPFHDAKGNRALYIGTVSSSNYKAAIDREWAEEKQRLLYVGMTRAEGLLYLPYVGAGSAAKLAGSYGILNRRLATLADKGQLNAPLAWKTFGGDDVQLPAAPDWAPLRAWTPDEKLLADVAEPLRFGHLLAAHQAYTVTSSTAMHRRERFQLDDDHHEKTDEAPTAAVALEDDELRPGIQTGLFLHSLLESVDPASLHPKPAFETWAADAAIQTLFTRMMRRYQVDARYQRHAMTLVFRAMTNALPLPGGSTVTVAAARIQREMEFLYPIPESFHPPIDEILSPDVRLNIERGFLKGFVDLIFEHEGKTYLADWKGNLLPPPYAPTQLETVVLQRYETQLRVYSLALVKLLGIHDEAAYEQRFGGILYVFLRGLQETGGGNGVYSRRPAWRDILGMEQWLKAFSY